MSVMLKVKKVYMYLSKTYKCHSDVTNGKVSTTLNCKQGHRKIYKIGLSGFKVSLHFQTALVDNY